MISLATAVSFFVLALVMALSPGPNLLYLVSRTLCQGRAAGFASLAGVGSGMLVYVAATAFGLAALFAAVPVLYEAMRLAGAGYLVWLAIKTIRAGCAVPGVNPMVVETRGALFRRGFATCLLNPKVVLTYGALLPQFVDPAAGNVFAQTLALGAVQIVAAMLAHSAVIFCAAYLARALQRRPRFVRAQPYLLAVALAGVALQLGWRRAP
ncbi:MAG: LysE family translocator [Betaproteobacteria bacterium]|nr:LysE family translocator [Betaproteobacteria bacterium]